MPSVPRFFCRCCASTTTGKPLPEFAVEGAHEDFRASPAAGKKSVRAGFCAACAYRLQRPYKIVSASGNVVPLVSIRSKNFSRASPSPSPFPFFVAFLRF